MFGSGKMEIKEIVDANNNRVDCNTYITCRRHFKYINTTLDEQGKCPICLEPHKNRKAHHLIPLRLKTKNKHLEELRIRICTKCHDKMHPENEFIVACQKMMGIVENLTGGEEDNIKGIKEIKGLLRTNHCLESRPVDYDEGE